ncbi:Polyketide synthase module [Legionella nautarum]|uniref:Polyketide synthase module n=2 Tax=Legionella nautarum TaxID=45070 RepID=A0A0W0WWT9_9GAMM|nr:Polyketide synthase module [Legionella nautarum]
MQHDSIHPAVVRLKKHVKEKSLCAYLVAKPNKMIVLDELQNFLANYLPSYMLPKDFFLVKSIPLKENEKIDLERLENEIDKQLIAPPTMSYNSLTSTQDYCLKT